MIQSIKFTAKNRKTNFYYIALAIIIVGFFILFNSKSYLPDNAPIINTDIGKQMNIGSTEISISRWEYNKEKNFMEIELAYSETDDSLGSKLKFSAKPKVNVNEKLPVKTIIATDNTYIIHVENIPKNYEAIAIKVSQNTNTISDTDTDTSTDDFSAVETNTTTDTNVNATNITLYCDYRKVKINDGLVIKTEKKYLTDITKSEINTMRLNISKIDKKTQSNKKLIDVINKKISDLNDQYKYEIEEEQNKTTEKISGLNSKIQDINNTNQKLQDNKDLTLQKIQKLQLKLNDLSKN